MMHFSERIPAIKGHIIVCYHIYPVIYMDIYKILHHDNYATGLEINQFVFFFFFFK